MHLRWVTEALTSKWHVLIGSPRDLTAAVTEPEDSLSHGSAHSSSRSQSASSGINFLIGSNMSHFHVEGLILEMMTLLELHSSSIRQGAIVLSHQPVERLTLRWRGWEENMPTAFTSRLLTSHQNLMVSNERCNYTIWLYLYQHK